MFRRAVAVIAAACGCGRVGFDSLASLGDGGTVGDGGTLVSLELPAGGAIDRIAIAPDGTWYANAVNVGMWRSTDEATWQRCAPGFALDLAVAGDGTVYAAAGSNGVLASTDRCASWTPLPVDRFVQAVMVRGGEVFALVDNGLRLKTAISSMFTMVTTPIDGTPLVAGATNGTGMVFGTLGSYILVNPNNMYAHVTGTNAFATPSVSAVAVGASRAYVLTTATATNNGGVSCANAASLNNFSVCFSGGGLALAIDPNDDQHLLFAPYDQLGQTEDGFQSFALDKQAFEMDAGNVNDLAFTQASGAIAVTMRGVFFAIDRNLRWQARNTGLSAWDVNDIVEHDGDLYLATQGGVMRSAGGTAPFTISTRGMILSTGGENVVVAPDGSLIAGSRGIWRSPDLGQTWTDLYLPPGNDDYRAGAFAFDGMKMYAGSHTRMLRADPPWTTWTPSTIAGQNRLVLSLVVTPDHRVWAGTDSGLFVSSDGAMTFTAIPQITNDVGGLLVLADGAILAATKDGSWISDPARLTWTHSGPSEITFRHAVIPNGLAAATDRGVYVSYDRAVTWTLVPGTQGFSTRAAYFDRGSGELVYGTIGAGLQRAPLP